ncbi:MAG: ATP-binding protein [Desulforegulaceae bacterium]|nr:ATP-binding protein [Desulforegulaceae bacterium]
MFNNFFKKLTFKHTLITISVVFITGALLSFFQIIYDISLTRKKITDDIKRLANITEEAAAQSLYHLDKVQAEKLIKGYIKYPPIKNASLTDNFGITLYTESSNKKQKSSIFKFFFSDQTENYHFNLFYTTENNSLISVGRLEIQTDYSAVYGEFEDRVKFIAVSNIFQNIFLALLIALIFHKSLTRPILKLSQSIAKINPRSPKGNKVNLPSGHEKDEMGSLASAINTILREYSDLNLQLEKRVEERTYDLQQANDKLTESLNQLENAKDKLVESEKMASLGSLVAGVSHEINTPVGNSVTAASYLFGKLQIFKKNFIINELSSKEIDSFISNSDEALDIIMKNLERAAKLVSSFKQIAVDQTYSSMRIFEFKKHIEDILMSLKPKLKGLDIEINIKCKENLFIFHDPGIFYQIFSNLIINSIIHGFESSQQKKVIEIDVFANDKDIKIMYMDNGKGINEKFHKKIFEPFFTTTKKNGGSGLGMYIIYNLVTQKLSGTIESLNSEKGRGACFFITFPFPKE